MTPAFCAPRLLVVDDEVDVCFAMHSYFTGRGFRVDTATSLDAALGCIGAGDYAAVVADLRLSGSDGVEGLELLRHVRATDATLPFILITGYGTPGVVEAATRLGVSRMLVKPQPLSDIADALNAQLTAAR
jgi:DNA-binding NtrC family response regulator